MAKQDKTEKEISRESAALFKQYIEPHFNLIYKTVSDLTSNPSNCDDNYQESLIWLLKYIHTYNPKMNIQTYIITCVKRYIGKLEGKRGSTYDMSEVEKEESDYKRSYKERYAPKSKIDYRFIEDENWFIDEKERYFGPSDEVTIAIDRINQKFARAFLMKHSMGMSLKEIAQMEKITENAVKARIFNAKKQLQGILKK